MHQFDSYAALNDILAHRSHFGVIARTGLGRCHDQRRAQALASRGDEVARHLGQKRILGRGGSGQGLFDPGEGFLQTGKTQSLDDVHSRREYATPGLSRKPARADAL